MNRLQAAFQPLTDSARSPSSRFDVRELIEDARKLGSRHGWMSFRGFSDRFRYAGSIEISQIFMDDL